MARENTAAEYPELPFRLGDELDGRMEHAILLEAISEKSLGTTMEKKR